MSATTRRYMVDLDADATMSVVRSGEGPQVVLVGGLGDDVEVFDPLLERWQERFECIAFDHRGSGSSSALPEGALIPDLAHDAHRLLERLDVGPVAVVGCSMGGAVVQEWALRYPDDIAAMVLISTWSRPRNHLLALLDHWATMLAAGEVRRVVESVALFALSPDSWDRDPELAAAVSSAGTLAPGFATQLAACRLHDTASRLADIEVPTLVVAGEQDLLVSPANASELHDRIAGSRLLMMPTGHVPFWEATEDTAEAVGAFLTQHAS